MILLLFYRYLADSFYLMFRPKLVRKIERIIAGNGKKHQDMFDKMELAYRKVGIYLLIHYNSFFNYLNFEIQT